MTQFDLSLDAPAAAPDPSLGGLFADPARAHLLKRILYLIEYDPSVLLLSGPAGAGKTTLLGAVADNAPRTWRLCRVDAADAPPVEALLQRVADGLGLDLAEGRALRDGLATGLARLAGEALRPVLLIDDADRLDPAALAELLAVCGRQGARVLLAGEPAAEALLGDAYQHRRLDLPPIPRELMAEYVRHRLRAAGKPEAPLPSELLLGRWHRRSAGLPGQIDALLAQDSPVVSGGGWRAALPEIPVKVAAQWTLLAGGMVLLLVLLSQGPDDAEPEGAGEARNVHVETLRIDRPLALPPVAPGPAAPAPADVPRAAAPAAEVAPAAPAVSAAPPAATAVAPPPAAKVSPPVAKVPPAPPPPEPADGLRREGWLRTQAPGKYTLQLMSLNRESSLVNYASERPEKQHLAYFRMRRDGRDWYTLVYGVYADQAAARAARAALPEDLAKLRPIVRSLGSIHAAIDEAARQPAAH